MDEATQRFALALWEVYLGACVCHLDWDSRCDCPAQSIAQDHLEELLGANWHERMRELTKVDD